MSSGQAILLIVILVAASLALGAAIGYRRGLGDLDHAEKTVARLEGLEARRPTLERILDGLETLRQQEADGERIMEAIRQVERSRTRRRKPPPPPRDRA